MKIRLCDMERKVWNQYLLVVAPVGKIDATVLEPDGLGKQHAEQTKGMKQGMKTVSAFTCFV